MAERARILIVDGYTREAREELVAGGASLAADLYKRMFRKCLAGVHCDVLFPADPGASLPRGVGLEGYDGVAWTGCSLTIYEDDPRVARQIELARAAYAAGVPGFGSCWAAQIAVVAVGGTVRANPRGREMGIARKIALTPEGRSHPLYEGKPPVFDAFISHEDEVVHLPAGAVLLASNAFTRVQAVAVSSERGTFWGLQYHPEYDLHEMARLTFCRIDKLVRAGLFRDRQAALDYVDKLETLHEDPQRKDLAWLLGVDEDVTSDEVRLCEVRNWIERSVLPRSDR